MVSRLEFLSFVQDFELLVSYFQCSFDSFFCFFLISYNAKQIRNETWKEKVLTLSYLFNIYDPFI